MINSLIHFCLETLLAKPSVQYARFEHWICSSGLTAEHTVSKKTLPDGTFSTLFPFVNMLVQFSGEHAGSVSCRFCVLDLLLSNSFSQYSIEKKGFVKGMLPDKTFSSIK